MKQSKFYRKRIRFIGVMAVLIGMLPIANHAVTAANGGKVLSLQNGFSMELDAANGSIGALNLASKNYRKSGSASGFYIKDEKTGAGYAASLPVSGSAPYRQTGTVAAAGVKLDADYTVKDNAVFISGSVTGVQGADKAVTLEYRIPLNASGMFFYDDFDTKRAIQPGSSYSNVSLFADPLTNNIYPFTTLSDGTGSITVGAPSDALQLWRVSYENEAGKGYLSISFSMGLTPKALKNPNKADFSFFIYSTGAADGMRSAAEKYYALFPKLFERRVKEGGNWMFQQAYETVAGLEDFGFKFNETPELTTYEMDKKNNILSFRYVAPTEQWIGFSGVPQSQMPTPAGFRQKIEELLGAPDSQKDYMDEDLKAKDVALAIKNSIAHNAAGEYSMAQWYAWGLPIVEYICNGMPALPGMNKYKIDLAAVQSREVKAAAQKSALGGVYIDNTNWVGGVYGFDYNSYNFKYADFPMVFDYNRNIALHLTFAQYRYIEEFGKYARSKNTFTLGNIAFPKTGAISYAHLLDLPGGEIGPTFSSDITDFRLRRALTYQKPWVLLYTAEVPTGGNVEGDMAYREELLKKSMVYGIWANTLGLGPSETTYEQNREINRKYLPVIRLLDQTGWEPLRHAALSGNSEGVVYERFGKLSGKNLCFTLMNTYTDRTYNGQLTVDLKALGSTAAAEKDYIAFDLITNRILKTFVDKASRTMTVNTDLQPGATGAYAVGTASDVFGYIKNLVFDKIKRSERAIQQIEYREERLPEGFDSLKKDVSAIIGITKKSTITAKDLNTLIEKLSAANMKAFRLGQNLEYSRKWVTADLNNMYSDAYDKLHGLFPNGLPTDSSSIIGTNSSKGQSSPGAKDDPSEAPGTVSGEASAPETASAAGPGGKNRPGGAEGGGGGALPMLILTVVLIAAGLWGGVFAIHLANKKGIRLRDLFKKG